MKAKSAGDGLKKVELIMVSARVTLRVGQNDRKDILRGATARSHGKVYLLLVSPAVYR